MLSSSFGEHEVIAPGIVSFPVDQPIGDQNEWAEYVGDLPLEPVTDDEYGLVDGAFQKTRNIDAPASPYAGDLQWHLDLVREGLSVGKLVTAIYYKQAGSHAPGTAVVDTVGLHAAMAEAGVFEPFDVEPETWQHLTTEFTQSTYHAQTLQPLYDKGNPEERAQIEAYIRSLHAGLPDICVPSDYAHYLEQTYPVAMFPLLTANPFNDSDTPAIMFDMGAASRDIIDARDGTSYKDMLHAMRAYFDDSLLELHERGIVTTVPAIAGHGLLMSREGSLHRALPGNDQRQIFLAWRSTIPATLL